MERKNSSKSEGKKNIKSTKIFVAVIAVIVVVSAITIIVREMPLATLQSAAAGGEIEYGSFVLSEAPGFYDEAFDLVVSVPSMPNVVIYYTIDGNEPHPEVDRYIVRGENSIRVSGRLPEDGRIRVEDRSGYWGYSILTYHHANTFRSHHDIRPIDGAEILQGTAFRFRAFADGEPVTEVFTATYIIAPDIGTRFGNRPIVSVTAPYEEFIYIYKNADRYDRTVRRQIFNYEYFEYGDQGYERMFSLPGSTSLGGSSSRLHAQRTLNVHFSRGELNGVIIHPIFPGVEQLYRFRLWNGGQGFVQDHMRDAFAQTASSGLNVLFSDNNLAIKFINGEFWGFTNMREHTSNRHFVGIHTGLDRRNIAILSIDNNHFEGRNRGLRMVMVDEGPEEVVWDIYNELIKFITSYDLSTDYARERLFNEFVCQINFMDYIISRTFFNNRDWPHNNMRIFRAITPDTGSQNPYNDGRWRFMLHDMDLAPPQNSPSHQNRFPDLYNLPDDEPSESVYQLRHIFLVLNNFVFAEQLRARGIYILDTEFQTDRLLALHEEFLAEYQPLLPEMYNRFSRNSVEESIANFDQRSESLARFLLSREYYYRKHLDALVVLR